MKAVSFAERMQALEKRRPRFSRERLDNPGAYPCTVDIAQMNDDGELEFNAGMRVYPEEMRDFARWILETWK